MVAAAFLFFPFYKTDSKTEKQIVRLNNRGRDENEVSFCRSGAAAGNRRNRGGWQEVQGAASCGIWYQRSEEADSDSFFRIRKPRRYAK